MGYQDAIASIGIHTTADNKPSNGTVDGVDSFDTKVFPTVDRATKPEISEVDQSNKYAGNVAAWSRADAYGNNEYAYEVAKNFLNETRYGTNPFSNDEFSKALYQQQGAGLKFFELA